MSLISPDFGLLFWMTLIFGIVFFVLAKFGFPLITGMVDKRSDRINESIAKAREAELRLSELADEQARMIEQARIEQSRILKEASDTRAAMIEKAKQEASAEAEKMLVDAKTQIANEKEAALRDIRREVAALSVEVAGKIVRKELGSAASQVELLEKLVEEASKARIS